MKTKNNYVMLDWKLSPYKRASKCLNRSNERMRGVQSFPLHTFSMIYSCGKELVTHPIFFHFYTSDSWTSKYISALNMKWEKHKLKPKGEQPWLTQNPLRLKDLQGTLPEHKRQYKAISHMQYLEQCFVFPLQKNIMDFGVVHVD